MVDHSNNSAPTINLQVASISHYGTMSHNPEATLYVTSFLYISTMIYVSHDKYMIHVVMADHSNKSAPTLNIQVASITHIFTVPYQNELLNALTFYIYIPL